MVRGWMQGGVENWGRGCNHPQMFSHPKLAHFIAIIDTFLLVSYEDYLRDLIPVILFRVRDARNGLEVVAIGLPKPQCSSWPSSEAEYRHRPCLGVWQGWGLRPPARYASARAASVPWIRQLSPKHCPRDGASGALSHCRGTWVRLPSGFCSSSSRTPRPWLPSVESSSKSSAEQSSLSRRWPPYLQRFWTTCLYSVRWSDPSDSPKARVIVAP